MQSNNNTLSKFKKEIIINDECSESLDLFFKDNAFHFDLFLCKINDFGFKKLLKLFINKLPVETLDLACTNLSTAHYINLFNYLLFNVNLRSLKLANCSLENAFENLINYLRYDHCLERLDLEDCKLFFTKEIANYFNYNVSLKILDIKRSINQNVELDILLKNTMLTELNLSNCKINLSILPIIWYNCSLESLILDYITKCIHFSTEEIDQLAQLITTNFVIKKLNLRDCNLDVKALKIISSLNSNISITDINFASNNLTGECFKEIANLFNLNTTLQTVNLAYQPNANFPIEDEIVLLLHQAIFQNIILKNVNLQGIHFTDKQIELINNNKRLYKKNDYETEQIKQQNLSCLLN
eukprot:TRINITY_DN918_c2_g1_i2.p1 TRINITY_DN918_c2_g1~~TRINITY_DN918_c2_g1_i2.p1  ORF type:complete len:356 (+),score=64.19 TRINITY_DN918_c2_g1_i2:48-1115(+)